MNLAYDERNLAGAVTELMQLAPSRLQSGVAVGRNSQAVDLTQAVEAEDFLRYRAETLAKSCVSESGRPTLEFPLLIGVAFWSIDVSLEPFVGHQGNGTLLPKDGSRPDYLVRFLKFLGA